MTASDPVLLVKIEQVVPKDSFSRSVYDNDEAETFSRFDAADYLGTDDEIAAYLEESARSGDPSLMAAALGTVARARNVSQLARDTGMTREGLYKALSLDGNPGFATVVKVANAMGFDVAFRARPAP